MQSQLGRTCVSLRLAISVKIPPEDRPCVYLDELYCLKGCVLQRDSNSQHRTSLMGGLNKGPALGRRDTKAAAQAIAKGRPNRELRTTGSLGKAERQRLQRSPHNDLAFALNDVAQICNGRSSNGLFLVSSHGLRIHYATYGARSRPLRLPITSALSEV